MCGDYNVDLLKLNSTPFNENYFDNILSAGYIPKITLPTRLSENSTLIDNIFTTNLSTDLSAYILDMHTGACPGIRKRGGPKSESLFFWLFNLSGGGGAQLRKQLRK